MKIFYGKSLPSVFNSNTVIKPTKKILPSECRVSYLFVWNMYSKNNDDRYRLGLHNARIEYERIILYIYYVFEIVFLFLKYFVFGCIFLYQHWKQHLYQHKKTCHKALIDLDFLTIRIFNFIFSREISILLKLRKQILFINFIHASQIG